MFRFTHDEHVPELSSVDPATNVLARLRLRSKERTTIWLIAYHRKMVHYSHSFWFSDLNKIWTELLDSYLNGPRTLSNERLSFLVVSQDPTHEGGSNEGLQDNRSTNGNYDILICATHFLGDGMALHFFVVLEAQQTDERVQEPGFDNRRFVLWVNGDIADARRRAQPWLPRSRYSGPCKTTVTK